MPKTHAVVSTDGQRLELDRLVSTGRESARKITRARVLLKAADGETDGAIAAALGVSVRTAERVRRRFAAGGGLAAAVERRPQPPRPQKRVLDGAAEARLTMLACSTPPDGHDRWTLDLLADRMVRLNYVSAVSRDTVARHLKKATSSRGGPSAPLRVRTIGSSRRRATRRFLARMEDVLDVYPRPYDPFHPVVAVDEKPVQLTAHAHEELPPWPGDVAKQDHEYERAGMAKGVRRLRAAGTGGGTTRSRSGGPGSTSPTSSATCWTAATATGARSCW